MAEEEGATTDNSDATAEDSLYGGAVDDSTQDQAPNENVDSNETQNNTDDGETLNLSDVSKVLGIDESNLDVDSEGELLFKTNIDGSKGTAKLTKLIMNHQLESHLNNKSMEVSELKKTLKIQVEEHKGQVAEKLKGLDDLTKVMQHELLSEFEGVDWNELKANDRDEYVFKQTEFKARKDHIIDLMSKLQTEKTKVSDEDKQKATDNAVAEQEKLKAAIPEWADDKKAVAEFTSMGKHAEVVGFSTEEFNRIGDHRALVVLRESMLYRKLISKKESTLKEVRKSPKFTKSGSSEVIDKNTSAEDVFYGSG